MSNPELTVIIPSFNHERFIEAAVRSVLDQSFRDIELLVIDDGSSDGSVAVLKRLAAENARMRVVEQPNAGSHATINRGLQMATTPWVSVLNSDDVWEPDRLQTLFAAAARSGADFLFSDCVLIDGEGEIVDDPAHWWNFSVQRLRDRARKFGVNEGMLYGNLAVSTSNFLFRRSVVANVGLFRRLRYNLDWDYVLRCLFNDDVRVEFVDRPLLRYRLHGRNAILSGMPMAAIEAQAITRRIYREHYHAPDSLILSHYRHDRLLRRFLSSEVRRYRASHDAIEAHRDELVSMVHQRQAILDTERRVSEERQHALREDITAIESDRDRIAGILTARIGNLTGRVGILTKRVGALQHSALEMRAARDAALCRQARLLDACYPKETIARRAAQHPGGRLKGWASELLPSWGRARVAASILDPLPLGEFRRERRVLRIPGHEVRTVAAHIHIFYLDLAAELIRDALQIGLLTRLVITGPWGQDDLEAFVGPARERGVDVRVLTIPNRGKDVGGLIAAIREGELLDADVVLKIHSKKSHNPATYFDAISALFGTRIENGDQWRRALIEPLIGAQGGASDILHAFLSDPTVGMAGAGAFITSAPDANAQLSQAIYERFGVPQGLAFVAGTMFWIRSSLLKPLLDQNITLDDFSLDSREVEGGLEHVMERLLGALVLGRGFDILGIDG